KPVRKPVSRNVAQRKDLKNAGRERRLTQSVIEIVGKKVRRRSSEANRRLLRHMIERQPSAGKDRLDSLVQIRVSGLSAGYRKHICPRCIVLRESLKCAVPRNTL